MLLSDDYQEILLTVSALCLSLHPAQPLLHHRKFTLQIIRTQETSGGVLDETLECLQKRKCLGM